MRPASPAAFRKSRLPSSSPTAHRLSAKYQSDQTGRPSIVATCAQPDNDALRHPDPDPRTARNWLCFFAPPLFSAPKGHKLGLFGAPARGASSKSECRNSKQARRPQTQNPKPPPVRRPRFGHIDHSEFEFVSDFAFRASRLPVSNRSDREELAELALIGFAFSRDPHFQARNHENWVCLAPTCTPRPPLPTPAGCLHIQRYHGDRPFSGHNQKPL